jgi:hypothetical protein
MEENPFTKKEVDALIEALIMEAIQGGVILLCSLILFISFIWFLADAVRS